MFDNITLNPEAKRLSVEYAKARADIDLASNTSRVHRRNARMVAVEVLHGELVHRNGHTVVVFPDQSEARF